MWLFGIALAVYLVAVPFGFIKPTSGDEFIDANGNKIVFRKR